MNSLEYPPWEDRGKHVRQTQRDVHKHTNRNNHTQRHEREKEIGQTYGNTYEHWDRHTCKRRQAARQEESEWREAGSCGSSSCPRRKPSTGCSTSGGLARCSATGLSLWGTTPGESSSSKRLLSGPDGGPECFRPPSPPHCPGSSSWVAPGSHPWSSTWHCVRRTRPPPESSSPSRSWWSTPTGANSPPLPLNGSLSVCSVFLLTLTVILGGCEAYGGRVILFFLPTLTVIHGGCGAHRVSLVFLLLAIFLLTLTVVHGGGGTHRGSRFFALLIFLTHRVLLLKLALWGFLRRAEDEGAYPQGRGFPGGRGMSLPPYPHRGHAEIIRHLRDGGLPSLTQHTRTYLLHHLGMLGIPAMLGRGRGMVVLAGPLPLLGLGGIAWHGVSTTARRSVTFVGQ
ncbi:uncharacterized protein LOC143519059 isoform X1 [Brachyhypopomus gauderio]|uniref:uncharacterized protein LOC143519059 isoform X1 n=1 Tax=Brachyhypopomus gauderio TaxID=698409 RepID=UPI0040416844